MAKKTTKKVSKKTVKKAVSSYDWTSQFNNPKVRKAIVKMVKATACVDDSDCILQADMSPEMFANTLLVYVPKAYKYLPKGLVADEAKQKALILLAELSKKDDGNGFARWTDPDPNTACALILMISKGVKSLDFTYSGGWDETSYDDCCSVEWHEGVMPQLEKKNVDYKVHEKCVHELFEEVKNETGVEDRDILYKFLDDSGAGDGNTYSQSLLIDLTQWKVMLHDMEEDEPWEDEDENDE
jgi:hypothetical protein